jgi:ParB-like chromosome segregation protein Spo0J
VALSQLGERLGRLRLCVPDADDRMRSSLECHGQLTAVTVFADGDVLQLVDGFKRMRSAQRLGWTSLRVRVLGLDEAHATAAIGVLHEHRGLTELEEGWIVRALCREHGLSQGAVARLLRRHKSWVSRRRLLVESLDEGVQVDVRLGLLSPRSAIAVAALPRGNQRRAAELVIQRGMTTRQAEALVQQLHELASDDARELRMNEWPEANPSPCHHARPRSDRDQLLADIATLMRVGVRLEVRLLDMPIQVEGVDVAREALAGLAALLDTLRQAITRAQALQSEADATLAQP